MSTSSPNLQFVLIDASQTGDNINPTTQINPNTTKLDTIIEHLRNPIRCLTQLNGSQTVNAGAVNNPTNLFIKADIDAVIYNNRFTIDLAANEITVQEDGTYTITVSLGFAKDGSQSGQLRKAKLFKNGVQQNYGMTGVDDIAFGGAAMMAYTAEMFLSAGDVISSQLWHGSNSPQSVNYHQFSMRRVSFDGLGD